MKSVPTPRERTFTVQDAGRLTGLSQHTLRYYEHVGLIPPVRRDSSSKHRQYSTEDIARLEALSCMRALGMRLDEMKAYLAMAGQGKKASRQMLRLLESQQSRLQQRLAEVQRHIKYNELKLQYWHAVESHDDRKATAIADRLLERLRTKPRSQ